MSTSFQVTGSNANAPFTLKIHRGDGMVLIAMNWRNGKPPRDFVGFSIEYREPGSDRYWPVKNRIGFPGERVKFSDPSIPSTKAPFQKFRWVHFPRHSEKPGDFRYRVTPIFMNTEGVLGKGEAQTADVRLRRDTIPGHLNIAFTRGYVSSQSFADKFAPDGKLSTLLPDKAKDGLTFKATHKNAAAAHEWMGFEARQVIHELLDEAIASGAEVRIIAYDFNLPELLDKLIKLGPRLKIIIDDSKGDDGGHEAGDSPESRAAKKLKASAGAGNVKRQHMANIQHHKSIAVSGQGVHRVVYGSTNFTWRGFYVQSNNAAVVTGEKAAKRYFDVFDAYFAVKEAGDFREQPAARGWQDLELPGLDAKVGFSPHGETDGLLTVIGKDIDKAKTSVFFSLAFLGQMKKGPIGPALGRAIRSKTVHALGIADAQVKAGNLGVTVLSPDNKRRVVRASALTGNVPAPFRTEPTGLSGSGGQHRGTRMHHKFVVIDFDTADARVYFGSYNFSEDADLNNGENLVCVRDRTVATTYMIEALRIYDHYRFRSLQEDAKKSKSKKPITLKLPPKTSAEKPWWQRDWDDPIRRQDRELFA
jgi:phosphatidylserine/phosphatidylglycerophosphate/cardiolipin synthase-like enzyme